MAEDILVNTIQTSNGNIKAILAESGTMKAAVTAIGGEIFTVKAKKLTGDITAKTNAAQSHGGDIGLVEAGEIANKVTIRAEDVLATIMVTVPSDNQKFNVFAYSNGTYSVKNGFSGLGATTIDVGAGVKFLGTMTFEQKGFYNNGESILTVTDMTGTATWYISGTDDSGGNKEPLVFKDLTGTFGWQVLANPFPGTDLTIKKKKGS